MDKITKAINVLGINASDIKDISQTTNLETTELYLQDSSVVKIKNNKVSLKKDNQTLVTIVTGKQIGRAHV